MILILTAGLAIDIETTQPTYVESATLLFKLPAFETFANTYSGLAPSLITSGEAISQIVMNLQSQNLIRTAGGTDDYDLELINLYNQDYPDYSYPYATLTATSSDAAETHWTFDVVTKRLNQVLAQRQAQVPPGNRIVAQIIGDTGPLIQTGSRKRALAGLAVLAMVAGASAWRFLGRWDLAGQTAAGYT
jgi:hypothetical protein